MSDISRWRSLSHGARLVLVDLVAAPCVEGDEALREMPAQGEWAEALGMRVNTLKTHLMDLVLQGHIQVDGARGPRPARYRLERHVLAGAESALPSPKGREPAGAKTALPYRVASAETAPASERESAAARAESAPAGNRASAETAPTSAGGRAETAPAPSRARGPHHHPPTSPANNEIPQPVRQLHQQPPHTFDVGDIRRMASKAGVRLPRVLDAELEQWIEWGATPADFEAAFYRTAKSSRDGSWAYAESVLRGMVAERAVEAEEPAEVIEWPSDGLEHLEPKGARQGLTIVRFDREEEANGQGDGLQRGGGAAQKQVGGAVPGHQAGSAGHAEGGQGTELDESERGGAGEVGVPRTAGLVPVAAGGQGGGVRPGRSAGGGAPGRVEWPTTPPIRDAVDRDLGPVDPEEAPEERATEEDPLTESEQLRRGIVRHWEKLTGQLPNAAMVERLEGQLEDSAEGMGVPQEWLFDAMRVAAQSTTHPTPNYVVAILRRWRSEGRGDISGATEDDLEARKRRYLGGALGHIVVSGPREDHEDELEFVYEGEQ